ncbi:MAG: VanZ family protein [Reyranellaceae bacterium]
MLPLRDLALRWRLPLLWLWAGCFPVLMFLYWSPKTSPPTGISGWDFGLDKPIHAATHGFMVLIPALMVSGRWRALAIGAGLATAVTLEFGQLFVPGRSFEPLDIAANTAGALLGWWVASRLRAS